MFEASSVIFAAAGVAVFVAAIAPRLLRNAPFSMPMVFLAAGMLSPVSILALTLLGLWILGLGLAAALLVAAVLAPRHCPEYRRHVPVRLVSALVRCGRAVENRHRPAAGLCHRQISRTALLLGPARKHQAGQSFRRVCGLGRHVPRLWADGDDGEEPSPGVSWLESAGQK